MKPETTQKLREVFRALFDLDDAVDPSGLSSQLDDRWDSMMTVNLIAALESEFDITVELAEAMELSSYDDAANLLAGRGL